MVIDFHTHIFPEKIAPKTIEALEERSGIKAATNGMLDGLLASMERNGVDMSVILPVVTKPSQFESINKYAAFINENYGDRLISFGGIHPDCEDYKAELNEIKRLGLKGIKLHPDYQGVMIDDVRYMNIIEYADELDLIILTHAGLDIGLPEPVHCTPKRAKAVIDKLKPKKLVLAHMGGWSLWDEVYEYLAGENVYFDTAFSLKYVNEEQFLRIFNKHDKKKLLFATDSPWSDAGTDLEALKQLPLKPEELNDILSGNAKCLLSL